MRGRQVRGAVTELLGMAGFKFKEGKREEYKRLSAQAMEIVRTKDSGTLQYDTYFNDDQSECIVIERHRDYRGGHRARGEPRRRIGGGPRDGLRGSRRAPR